MMAPRPIPPALRSATRRPPLTQQAIHRRRCRAHRQNSAGLACANKKAFDDYQAQSAKEPLAVKLADSVGHVRVATNFAWTLNTGYLVLFMPYRVCSAYRWAGSEKRMPPT